MRLSPDRPVTPVPYRSHVSSRPPEGPGPLTVGQPTPAAHGANAGIDEEETKMFRRKRKKVQSGGDAVGSYTTMPSEFLTWSEKKQKAYIRELLRSTSPGKVSDRKAD